MYISAWIWIGLNDLVRQGSYVWQDGSPASYTAWGPRQPNGGNERCVRIASGYSYKWADHPCSYTYIALCEAD